MARVLVQGCSFPLAMPAMEKAMPAKEKAMPTKEKAMPAKEKAVPSQNSWGGGGGLGAL